MAQEVMVPRRNLRYCTRRLRVCAIETVLLVCLASVAACGGSSPTSPTVQTPAPSLPPSGVCGTLGVSESIAILNGTECRPDTSAVVLLNMRDRSGQGVGACSGTIIAPRAILTAAHCLSPETSIVRVWLGTGAELIADSFARHPAYRGSGTTADVGVVLMAQDLPRAPIPLLLSRDGRVGEAAVIAGWGRDQSSVPATLRAGATTITGVSGTLLETQFAPNVSSVCSGDSGGAILLSEGGIWSVAGVTSATSENICNTGTNFYVSVRNPSVSSFVLDLVPQAGQR